MTRTLVLWCPDWPVVTALQEAGRRTSLPAAVFTANRVQACTAAARTDGVTVGQRRREAQSRCPELVVLKADRERDAREFERVAVAAEALAPGLEVLRPGLLACPVRGPARYFRSEVKAAEVLVDTVEALGVECRIGVADSLEVAVLAARRAALVPAGGSAEFCAPLPIAMLAAEPSIAGDERPALVDLLVRLGLTTLGAYASLPETKVGTRFGADGVLAHRLARGLGERAVSRRHIPPDLTTRQLCDPPLDRVDTAAFAARALAETFHQRLAAADLSCTRLLIGATTELGRELTRTWRCASPLTPAATADRLRWQLDGWLSSSSSPGAITSLTLEPVEAIGGGRIQFGLWGSEGEGDQRAGWALARVQGLLGPESVLVPALSGGRSPSQRITLIPWGQERVVARDPAAPWPGAIPAPSPTRIRAPAGGAATGAATRAPVIGAGPVGCPAVLQDIDGAEVTVTDRGLLSARPHWFRVDRGKRVGVVGWGGPWPVDERWWDAGSADAGPVRAVRLGVPPVATAARRPRARIQLEILDAAPLLLAFADDGWEVEGVYD